MIGRTVSHYRILEPLGAGGMGVVYKAEDLKLHRFVALKFLPQTPADDSARKRFVHEAQTASSLEHPNICSIYEIDETADGRMFIVMPCYEGESLQSRLERGPLALEEALSIATQVASGLSKAHEKGIVHRDIKPGNVFLTNDGLAKIVDFGLAKLAGQTKLTKEGATPGTVPYMSPEQIKGADIDRRSDIWSLGVVLYEMISGQSPFGREYDSATIYSIMSLEPAPLAAGRTRIPAELGRMVEKCLAKNPGSRYQNAGELRAELRELESGLQTGLPASPARASRPVARTGAMRMWIPLAVFAAAVLGFLVLRPMLFREAPVAAPKPIAVISFTNQTGDASYDYLQEVIPNLLITSLEQSDDLSVVTWERLHDLLVQMGRSDVGLIDKEIGFELCRKDGIDTIVLGSYTRAGDVFVTDVKVLDARTKELLQSASARGNGVGSILQNQIDELGRAISRGAGLSERRQLPAAQPIAEVTTASIEAYNDFLRGREQYEKLYFADAGKLFERAVELDSTFALAHLYLARTHNALRSVKAASAEFEKARAYSQRAPEKERLYFQAAYARSVEKDVDKQGAILMELVTKYPKEKQAHMEMAQYYRWKNLFSQARSECDAALQLDPSFGLALNEMAYIFVDLKDYEKAVEYFDRYASFSPGEANPFDSMGEMYFRMGKLDDAIAKYEHALEIKPDFGAERWLAYICALQEDFPAAQRWLDRFIAAAPTPGLKAQGYGIKGFYCAWVGNLDESIENHRKGTELFESAGNEAGKGRFAWVKCWTYYEAGDVGLCRKSLQDGIQMMTPFISPSSRLTMSIYESATLALLDLKEGRTGPTERRLAGIDSLLQELAHADTTSLVRARDVAARVRAEALLAADSVEKAIRIAEPHYALDIAQLNLWDLILYNVPPERDVLARCFAKAGAIDRAIAEYERLVTFDPESADRRLIYPKFHYRLGRLYEEKGLGAEATGEYRKFLDICGGADQRMTEVMDARARIRRLTDALAPSRTPR
jgi:tetratricopeptide (TPR) repeat protein/TolB-like protein